MADAPWFENSGPSGVSQSRTLRLAVGQLSSSQETGANVQRVVSAIESASSEGSQFLVLPECVLTGYMYNSVEEARTHALNIESAEIVRVREACRINTMHLVVGFLEADDQGRVYNSAVLIDDQGAILGTYRKVHLPCLGVDRYVTAGVAAPPVIETAFGRVGLAICYDLRFPESARSLALLGADLIAQPSTMPAQAAMLLEHFVPVRASENRVFLALANRGDSEAGTGFVGRSQIVAPDGTRLAEASTSGNELIFADVDLASAQDKDIVNEPGVYEVSLFRDRRPDTYAPILNDQKGLEG